MGGYVVALAGLALSRLELTMSGHRPKVTSFPESDPRCSQQFSSETLARCARLLAAGEMDWPDGLSKEQEEELLTAVRRWRRARLINLIASRIAADLAAEAGNRAKEAHP
jgi:hypothetical protein